VTTTGRRLLLPLVVTIGAPALVTLLAFTDTAELIPALLYVLAIAAATAVGGPWFGVAASVLSFIPFIYFFTNPRHQLGVSEADELVAGMLFLITAIGIGALIEREKRARTAAQEAARNAERLQRAADALSFAVTPAQVLDAVLTETIAAADARAGMIAFLSEDGTQLEIVAERGYDGDLMRKWQTFPVDAGYPLSEAVATGEPVFLRSEQERIDRFPALGSIAQTHALVCLPLIVEDRTIGGLVFSFQEDQDFDEARRALKVALARQAAQALERARLYEAVESAEARVSFVAEASELLASPLDYEETLSRLAEIWVPGLADWCTVDVLDEQGQIKRVAVAHINPAKAEWGWELHRQFPPDPDEPTGMAKVLRTGDWEFMPEIPQDLLDEAAKRTPGLGKVIDELGLRSWICVPLKAHDKVLGALSLVTAESGRAFTQADLDLAIAVASRAGIAVENALLYRESERRGDAARALTYVGDAVILLDDEGVVRFWNRTAETISGCTGDDAIGRSAADVVPGWETIKEHVQPAHAESGDIATSSTVPLTVAGEERWLSAAAVDFGDGCVYALRDVTEEHALEQARSDFVATASHELRTPLAAVYGAVRTLRRRDVDIGDENKEMFLEIIESETERLNTIVGQILLAGQLESETLRLNETACALPDLVRSVLATARVRAPESVSFEVHAPDDLPPVRCDEDKLRQVLVNLVENAIKYSPDGGEIEVDLRMSNGNVRLDVRDVGLGIPPADHARIFEKFTRLDPGLSRGVGGTGLGLYIARELTERMGGEITIASTPGEGSTFTVELPVEPPR
jgi:PAS domain S-box-containing protein